MAIDRADWHWDSAEEGYREAHGITGDLTQDQVNQIWLLAANHIGLFLQWIIDRGFEGEDADPQDCARVRAREMSGAEYLMVDCDGKLWESDIRDDVLPFVMAYYYDEDGEYLGHYSACCLDDDDKPIPVPKFTPETLEEQYEFSAALNRQAIRKQERAENERIDRICETQEN